MNFDKIDAQVDQWILEGQNNVRAYMVHKERIRRLLYYYYNFGIMIIEQ